MGVGVIRHTTRLWSRPVIRYRSTSGTYRWTTSPARSGTGERVVPTGEPVQQMTRIQSHWTKSVGLYHPTQRTHIQLNMSSEVRVSETSTIPPVLVGKKKKIPCPNGLSLEQSSLKDGQKDRSEKDREDVGTNQRPVTLVVFVRNSKGCEDTNQPVPGGCHCWGVRSKGNNCPKNPRHLGRTEQRHKIWSLLSGLGRIPT